MKLDNGIYKLQCSIGVFHASGSLRPCSLGLQAQAEDPKAAARLELLRPYIFPHGPLPTPKTGQELGLPRWGGGRGEEGRRRFQGGGQGFWGWGVGGGKGGGGAPKKGYIQPPFGCE